MHSLNVWRSCALAVTAGAVVLAQQIPQASSSSAANPTYSATAKPILQSQPSHAKAMAPTDTYFRVICVLPVVGTGKAGDPIRPSVIPIHKPGDAYHSGIIAWTQVPSDDGRHAIVEIVATDRAALLPILNTNSADVVVYERGKHTLAETEAGIQKYRKDFTLEKFPRAVAQ